MALLIASLLALAVQDTEPRIFRLIRDGAGVDQLRPMLEKDPELVRVRGNLEETPLHDAARFGSLEVVTLLVEKGSDVNKTCYNRFTPLWFACSGGKVDVVKYLLSKGADLEAPSNGGTPLQARNAADPDKTVEMAVQKIANERCIDFFSQGNISVRDDRFHPQRQGLSK
jgi:ankyrin repeat protein